MIMIILGTICMGASSLLYMLKEESRYKPILMFFIFFGAILTIVGLSSVMAEREQIKTQSAAVTRPEGPNTFSP